MLAAILFAIGGLEWAVWGVSVRVTLSVGGHWLISYFAHTCGESHWQIKGAAAQGYNLRIAALLSMGESWHNNHHAYQGDRTNRSKSHFRCYSSLNRLDLVCFEVSEHIKM